MQLTLENIGKTYGKKVVLHHLTCTFSPGIHGILGPNGVGKTTMLRLLATVTRPTCGVITLDGVDVRSLGAHYRARLGYQPQEGGFYRNFTCWRYLLYIAELKDIARQEAKTRAEQLIEQLNLSAYRNTAIRKLSGGTRHRLGLAQALLNDPDILILDEPTAGLDPVERMRFRRILAQLSGDRIVIVSTHILADLDASAGAIALIKGGTIFAQGSQADIAQTLRGRVWEVRIPAAQVESLQSRGQIINIRREDGDRVLRMIADRPPTADAIPAQPTLDDVYLAEFPEEVHSVTPQEAHAVT